MGITRRGFIQTGAMAAVGLGLGKKALAAVGGGSAASGSSSVRAASAALAGAVPASEKILVVVNLYGGNDGLNTVVPVAAAEYNRYRQLRPKLRYNLNELLPLTGEPDFRLNPGMVAFQTLFSQGRLAIINGVSVPESAAGLFDHETGQYEFQSCDIVRNGTSGPPTGWLGRFLDNVPPGSISPGIDFGGGRLMLTGAQRRPISISTVDRFQLQVSDFDRTARRAAYQQVMGVPNADASAGEPSRLYRLQALQESEIIRTATASYVPSVTYPDSWLAFQLRECAKIIYGNVGARALAVPTGGFDTHGDQNSGNNPYHESLLRDVSDSVSAFYADLVNQGLSNRVLILTISEFGRRAYENGDKGTDHGLASLAFALGDEVNGGIYGLYPSLNSLVLDGNLAGTTDFRSVYSSVLGNYLEVDPVPIVGGSFPSIAFV